MKLTDFRNLGLVAGVLMIACAGASQAGAQDYGAAAADRIADEIKGYNDFAVSGETYMEISAADEVAKMGVGVNVLAGGDGYWKGGPTKFKLSQIYKIKAAGFSTLRIPLEVFGPDAMHVDVKGNLDPDYLKRLDAVVEAALSAKLFVILDEDDDGCGKDPDACAQILPGVWDELSRHYKNAPASLMFELLNEPHGNIDPDTWNAWIPDLINIVRQTNPTRNIVIGPTNANGISDLAQLKLPDDKHIIVTFHYYDPLTFTLQGADWAGPEIAKERGEIHWTGSPEELARITTDFDQVKAWAEANNRPILLGAYGTYGKFSAMDERVAWTRAVSKAAADRHFARAAWYFDASNDDPGISDPGLDDLKKAFLQ